MHWKFVSLVLLTAGFTFAQDALTGGCFGKPPADSFTAVATASGTTATVNITRLSASAATQYSVVWGDGTITTGGLSQSKTYARGIDYSVQVREVGGMSGCRVGRVWIAGDTECHAS